MNEKIKTNDISPNMYETVIKIRAFEEHVLDMFEKNLLSGTTHTYIGEEATAVAIMQFIRDNDTVFSNHRCHGHYLAYGGSEKELLAELMSKESGICHGKGGSQHLHYKNFYTNGIQGGIVPNALGVAFSDKLKGNDNRTIVFLGDGTLGQGVVYEAFNLAAILDAPMVFVVEDNGYAMSTKCSDVIYGDISERIQAFGIKTYDITSTDTDELYAFLKVCLIIYQEKKSLWRRLFTIIDLLHIQRVMTQEIYRRLKSTDKMILLQLSNLR